MKSLLKIIRFFPLNIVIMVFLVFPSSGFAETRMTWKECVEITLKNNPSLQAARESYSAAKADLDSARSGYYPQVSADAGYAHTKNGSSQNDYSYSLSARQLIFDGFSTRAQVGIARQGVMEQENSYIVTSAETRVNLRSAFIELVRAQEFFSIARRITERRRDNYELVRMRHEAGKEHRGSLLMAEANLAKARADEVQAGRKIALARRNLITQMGINEGLNREAVGALEISAKDEAEPDFQSLAKTHPSLRVMAARREAARCNLDVATAGHYPSVYASASAGKTGSGFPPSNTDLSVGLSASMPLFEGFNTVSRISKARAEYSKLVAEERNERSSVILALQQKWTDFRSAIDTVAVEEEYLKAATERAKIAEAQYSIGAIQYDNWVIIEDDLVNIQKSSIEARANALVAETKWLGSQGVTFDYDK